jgi:hypothetical protein
MSDNDTPSSQPPKKQTSSVSLKKETVRVHLKASDSDPSLPNAPLKKDTVRVTMRATDGDSSLSKHTSLVPLKKETVRVTLKASDASVPSATVPLAAPVRPPISPTAPTVGAPRPPAPAPTIALKKGPPTAPTAAPTIPLRTAAPTSISTPTIRLATTNTPIGTAPITPPGSASLPGATPAGLGTKPTIPGTSPSVTPTLPGVAPTLPKATVQLQPPTQPIGTTPPSLTQAATLKVEDDEDDEGATGTLLKLLSGVGLAAAIALLAFQLMLADVWINVEDNPNQGDWSQLFESNS